MSQGPDNQKKPVSWCLQGFVLLPLLLITLHQQYQLRGLQHRNGSFQSLHIVCRFDFYNPRGHDFSPDDKTIYK